MNARRAQLRMLSIEMHDQEFNVQDYLTWLCRLDDSDPVSVEAVLAEEVRRAQILADNHYARVTRNLTVMSPYALLTIGFQQGATFAAAALGRETYKEEHGES